MTVHSVAADIGSLTAFYRLNESGGTTATDLSSNALNATYSATKVDGAELTTAGGTSLRSTLSPGLYAQRSVGTGTPLHGLQAQTLYCWYNPASMLTTGGWPVFGRVNNMRLMLNASGSIGVQLWLGGVVTDLRWPAGWTAAGVTQFVAATWDGTSLKLYVNGEKVLWKVLSGTITATTDALLIAGTSGSNGFDGDIKDCGVHSRALNGGEIMRLFVEGTKTPLVSNFVNRDNLYATNPIVSGSGVRCAGDGRLRAANGPAVIVGGTEYWDVDCYAAEAQAKTLAPITSSSGPDDYDQAILRVWYQMMQNWTQKVTNTTKTHYFDSSGVLQPQASLIGNADIWGPFGLSAALVAHHQGLSSKSWLVQIAINTVERLLSCMGPTGQLLQPSTSPSPGADAGWDFNQGPLGEAVLCLQRHVDKETYRRWKAALIKSAVYEQNYPLSMPEAQYYVNGNREAGSNWGAFNVWLVAQTQQTLEWFQEQVAFWLDPEPKTSGNHAIGQGLVIVPGFAPTLADGSDGKGYMQERGSGPNTIMDGYCPNYVALCNSFVARAYLSTEGHSEVATERAQLLRVMNLQYNLNMDRVNTTTATVNGIDPWGLDGRGGSRQNNPSTFTTISQPVLKWKAGRSDITAAYVAAQWNNTEKFFLGNLTSTGIMRTINTDLASLLMATPQWPGLPEAA